MRVCSMHGNLGTQNQNKRLRAGIILFALTLAASVVLVRLHVAPGYRLALFVPFFFASNFVYMALFKTCGFLAAKGVRDLDQGPEKIANPTELAEVRRLGLLVVRSTLATATIATAALMLAP